jgi:hypothetical protein
MKRLLILSVLLIGLVSGVSAFSLNENGARPEPGDTYANEDVNFYVGLISGTTGNDYRFEFYNNGNLIYNNTITKESTGIIGPSDEYDFSGYSQGQNTANLSVTEVQTGETNSIERSYNAYTHDTNVSISDIPDTVPPGNYTTEAEVETDWNGEVEIYQEVITGEGTLNTNTETVTGPVDRTVNMTTNLTPGELHQYTAELRLIDNGNQFDRIDAFETFTAEKGTIDINYQEGDTVPLEPLDFTVDFDSFHDGETIVEVRVAEGGPVEYGEQVYIDQQTIGPNEDITLSDTVDLNNAGNYTIDASLYFQENGSLLDTYSKDVTINTESKVELDWDWNYSTNDFSSNAEQFWNSDFDNDNVNGDIVFGQGNLTEGTIEGLDFRTASVTIEDPPFDLVSSGDSQVEYPENEVEFWLSNGNGTYFTAPIYANFQDSNESMVVINESSNDVSTNQRSGQMVTLRRTPAIDPFTVEEMDRVWGFSGSTAVPVAPESTRRHVRSKTESLGTNAERVTYEFYLDFNEEWTDDYTGPLYINTEIGNETYSEPIYFSNNIVFDSFRSSSSVSSKDTTLNFDVEKDISEFEESRLRVSQVQEDTLRYDANDSIGSSINVTNVAGEPLIIEENDRPVTTWLNPLQPGEEKEILVPPSYRGLSAEEYVSVLSTRLQLFERENITEEVEIDGEELPRGELNAEFFFEDNMTRSGTQDGVTYGDEGNTDTFDRQFKIREDTLVGSFYQFFDNAFEWDDWVPGLALFMLISVGGLLIIDLKLSMLMGITWGLLSSIALLFTGILPLQINLLIVVVLAIIVTMIGRRIFS